MKLHLYFIFICCNCLFYNAQSSKDSELYHTLKKQDSVFFERSFNQCDMDYLEKHIAPDLKFYHDTGGFQNREVFFENTKNNICSNPLVKPIRKVRNATLEVYQLYENGKLYGAIQSGLHDFFIRENGKTDRWTSTAKFTHVWVLDDDNQWVLSTVLSYAHEDPDNSKNK